MVLLMQVLHRGDSESNGVCIRLTMQYLDEDEAFGKALLPRPQSTVRYHSTNGHERQVGLLEDRVQSRAGAQVQGRWSRM